MLARSATAGQATFEPEEDDEDEEEDEDEEDEEPEEPEDELDTDSFLSLLPPLSPEPEPEPEEVSELSDFLPSEDPLEDAAGSGLFWGERLSVR
jgi:hypothetical protein